MIHSAVAVREALRKSEMLPLRYRVANPLRVFFSECIELAFTLDIIMFRLLKRQYPPLYLCQAVRAGRRVEGGLAGRLYHDPVRVKYFLR
jgi:hypothetical protein